VVAVVVIEGVQQVELAPGFDLRARQRVDLAQRLAEREG